MRQSLKKRLLAGVMSACLVGNLAACSGGGGNGGGTTPATSQPATGVGTIGPFQSPELRNLTVAEIQQILAQAIEEAEARGANATIAIVDRVGNVLAVFSMNDATLSVKTRSGPAANDAAPTIAQLNQNPPPPAGPGNFGAQGLFVPRVLAAISKAVTGAYLASSGNAFTTRTASMIAQEHFPPSPASVGLESGPLFGVQFTQLPCSDLNTRFDTGGDLTGPNRAPLGLSADPGGIPLYKDGVVVGAIGVMADNDYGFDTDVLDVDTDVDEIIAVAGTEGFAAPRDIRADRIAVDGTTLRYVDMEREALVTDPTAARAFTTLNGLLGTLVDVPGYFDSTGGILDGTAFRDPASGIRQATAGEFTNTDIHVLVDSSNNNRFPPIAATDGASVTTPLTEAEVRTLLNEAFNVMSRARAQIRRPLNSIAQVTISVVDTNGTILGVIRSPDAPVFGTDTSLQKARTAAFFSGANAENDLEGATLGQGGGPDPRVNNTPTAVQTFLGDPNALTGGFAFADRSGGNLSRPYFPDGEVGTANGPLSLPITQWSPLATGLQTDLVGINLVEHITFVYTELGGGTGTDTRGRCTFVPDVPGVVPGQNRLQNGIQIFPGSVPIYRGNELVGGIGISGDGIDQDDMISFLGLNNAGVTTGTINNADPSIRADNITVTVNGTPIRLRYVNCPFNPFVGSNEQNVCQGL